MEAVRDRKEALNHPFLIKLYVDFGLNNREDAARVPQSWLLLNHAEHIGAPVAAVAHKVGYLDDAPALQCAIPRCC